MYKGEDVYVAAALCKVSKVLCYFRKIPEYLEKPKNVWCNQTGSAYMLESPFPLFVG